MVVTAITAKYFIFGKKKTLAQMIRMLLLPIAFFALYIAVDTLLQQRLGTSSGNSRIDDFVAGYNAWKKAPVFGNGFGNMDSVRQYMSSFRFNNVGFSNSPMMILAYGGIYLFIPYLISLILGISNALYKANKRTVCFAVGFIYLFVFTVIPFQWLTIFMFTALATGFTNSYSTDAEGQLTQ